MKLHSVQHHLKLVRGALRDVVNELECFRMRLEVGLDENKMNDGVPLSEDKKIVAKQKIERQLIEIRMQVAAIRYAHLYEQMEKLNQLPIGDSVPSDLLFETLDVFINEEESIFELQTLIFNLETRKMKLMKDIEMGIALPPKDKDVFITQRKRRCPLLTPRQHKLREMLAQPTKETCFIEQLVSVGTDRSARSFESRRIRSYISSFWESFEKNHGDSIRSSTTTTTTVNSKKKNINKNELPLPYFIEAMADYIIEEHMPQIYRCAMKASMCPDEDAVIASKCRRFEYLTQEQLNIKKTHASREIIPFIDAIARLRSIYLSLTPSKKMFCILQAAEEVFKTVKDQHPSMTIGGDEFLDLWIYVTLKANVKNLASTIKFINDYASPVLMQGEMGYYFSTIELAAKYIKGLDDFMIQNVKLQSTNRTILVCEREKYIALASQPQPQFNIVQHEVRVFGYSLFVVKEWLLSPTARFFTTVLVKRDENDHGHEDKGVLCSEIQVNVENTSLQQKQFLDEVFFSPTTIGLTAVEALDNHGVLLVADQMLFGLKVEKEKPCEDGEKTEKRTVAHTLHNSGSELTLLPLLTGDFEIHWPMIKRHLVMRAMDSNITDDTIIATATPPDILDNLRYTFNIDTGENIDNAIVHILLHAKILLRILGYISTAIPIEVDGVLNFLYAATIAFQKNHNTIIEQESTTKNALQLPTNGLLGVQTQEVIITTVRDILELMDTVGVSFHGNNLQVGTLKDMMEWCTAFEMHITTVKSYAGLHESTGTVNRHFIEWLRTKANQ